MPKSPPHPPELRVVPNRDSARAATDAGAAVKSPASHPRRAALASAGIPFDPTIEEVADYLPDRAHMAMGRL